MHLIEATEAEAKAERSIVAPWYYEELAIMYGKQKNYPAEIAILERYFTQPHAPTSKLQERLIKARMLLAKHS